MTTPKYKPTMRDFEQAGGIAKLERDGFNNEQIHKHMYNLTDGASTTQRQIIMKHLYDRAKSR